MLCLSLARGFSLDEFLGSARKQIIFEGAGDRKRQPDSSGENVGCNPSGGAQVF